MARLLALTKVANEAGSLFVGSGLMLMLGMVIMSISIMSLLVFACADDGSGEPHRKRRHGGADGGGYYAGNGGYVGGYVGHGGHVGGHGGHVGGHGGGGCGGGGGGGGGC